MPFTIERLSLGGVGNFNCYLLSGGTRRILVDTGVRRLRERLVAALRERGCGPGGLDYAILTNGTMDSIGNAFFIKEEYGARIAISARDAPMLSRNGSYPRRFQKPFQEFVYEKMVKKLGERMNAEIERFEPDIALGGEGFEDVPRDELKVLHTPGFTPGSICLLVDGKSLVSGNSLVNAGRSHLPPFVLTDFRTLISSVAALDLDKIERIYPGIGEPFAPPILLPKSI